MKIVLFGSSDLTLSVAKFLYENHYEIAAIVTVPRVFKISYKPDNVNNSRFIDMSTWGKAKSIPVFVYENANQVFESIKLLKADFAIVVGWYHMIPKKLRDLFVKGCAGFHASMLPKLRGGAPLNWSILLEYKETGVTFFELSDGVDDGLLYAQEKFAIDSNDYIGDLIRKTEISILKILSNTLPKVASNALITYQQEGLPSYCGQRIPEDSRIDWNQSVDKILLLIKASSKPYAGAYSFLQRNKVIIWSAEIANTEIYGAPGQILLIEGHTYIVCGTKALKATVVTIEGDDNLKSLEKANHMRLSVES